MVKKSKKLKKVPEKKRKRFEELSESPQKDLKKHKLQQQEIIKEPILIQLAQSTFHELTQNSTEEEYIEISATKDALEIEEENNSTFEEAKGNILDKVEPIPTQLSLEDWEARECGSDGNCFYRSICYLLNYSPDDHLSLRKKTIINIRNKIDDYLEYYFDEGVNLEEYLQNQSRSKQYTGEFEIRSLSDCIKRTIVIFIPTYSNNIVTAYKFYQLYGNEYYSSNSHLYLLYTRRIKHYQALEQITDMREETVDFENSLKEKQSPKEKMPDFIENLLSSNLPRRYVEFSKTVDRYNEVWDYQKNNKIPQRYFFQEQNEDIKTSGENDDEKKKKVNKEIQKKKLHFRKKKYEWKKGQQHFFINLDNTVYSRKYEGTGGWFSITEKFVEGPRKYCFREVENIENHRKINFSVNHF